MMDSAINVTELYLYLLTGQLSGDFFIWSLIFLTRWGEADIRIP